MNVKKTTIKQTSDLARARLMQSGENFDEKLEQNEEEKMDQNEDLAKLCRDTKR